MVEPTDYLTTMEGELSYPQPLGYQARLALAQQRARAKPRYYHGGAFQVENAPEQIGARQVVKWLMDLLDDRWAIFQNLTLPGEKQAIDLVLVGKGGICVIEVGGFGNWRKQNGAWYRETSEGRWEQERVIPGTRALDGAARLGEYLGSHGIQLPRSVQAVVALVWDHPLAAPSNQVQIWRPLRNEEQITTLRTRDEVPALYVSRIESALEDVLFEEAAALT